MHLAIPCKEQGLFTAPLEELCNSVSPLLSSRSAIESYGDGMRSFVDCSMKVVHTRQWCHPCHRHREGGSEAGTDQYDLC